MGRPIAPAPTAGSRCSVPSRFRNPSAASRESANASSGRGGPRDQQRRRSPPTFAAPNEHQRESQRNRYRQLRGEARRVEEEQQRIIQSAGKISHHANADKGYSAVAEKLGVTQAEVRRGQLTHTQTTLEAKQAAREAGIIDNDSAMLKVAESPPVKQVETVSRTHSTVGADRLPRGHRGPARRARLRVSGRAHGLHCRAPPDHGLRLGSSL